MRTFAVAAIILVSHRASAQSPATDAGIVEQYAASDASGAVSCWRQATRGFPATSSNGCVIFPIARFVRRS